MADAPQDRAGDPARKVSVYDRAENAAAKGGADIVEDIAWARGEASPSDATYYAKHARKLDNGRTMRAVDGGISYKNPFDDNAARPSKGKHGKNLRKGQ